MMRFRARRVLVMRFQDILFTNGVPLHRILDHEDPITITFFFLLRCCLTVRTTFEGERVINSSSFTEN